MLQILKNVTFFTIAIGLIISLSKNILEYHTRRQVFVQYEKQLQEQRDQNKKLRMAIAQSRDYFAVEEVIREKLNKTKPGEYVILMPSSPQTSQSASQQNKPTYRQWFDLFFN